MFCPVEDAGIVQTMVADLGNYVVPFHLMVHNAFLIAYVSQFGELPDHLDKLLLVFGGELMECVKATRPAQIIKVVNG